MASTEPSTGPRPHRASKIEPHPQMVKARERAQKRKEQREAEKAAKAKGEPAADAPEKGRHPRRERAAAPVRVTKVDAVPKATAKQIYSSIVRQDRKSLIGIASAKAAKADAVAAQVKEEPVSKAAKILAALKKPIVKQTRQLQLKKKVTVRK